MPIIRLSAASKIEGAPSRPFLSKITKEYEKYPFLRSTDKGWRIDTDDPAWADYLRGRREKAGGPPSAPPLRETAAKHGVGKPAKPKPPPELDNEGEASRMSAAEAHSFAVIQKAQKAEIDKKKAELELGVMEKRYVEKTRMVYLMGYFQRAITEGIDDIKRGDINLSAVKLVCDKLKEHIARAADILQKEEGFTL